MKTFLNLNNEKLKISLILMNYHATYGFEIVEPLNDFLITPQAVKMSFFHVMSALATNSGVLCKSNPGAGKKQIFYSLSKILAKPFFIFNFLGNFI